MLQLSLLLCNAKNCTLQEFSSQLLVRSFKRDIFSVCNKVSLVKWRSECFCSRVHCVAATQSLRKTGSSNPQWNAELDSVQPGWLMHQVPNTMQLLWWGDVLCARHFTAAFLSPLCLAGASLFREGKTHPECFRALKSYLLLLLLLLLVPSQDTALHLKRYWNPSVPACHSQRLIWPLPLCFVRSETQPAAAFKGCWAGYQFKLLSCLNGITWRGPAALFLGQFFIQKHVVTGCDGTFLLWLTCVSVYSSDWLTVKVLSQISS